MTPWGLLLIVVAAYGALIVALLLLGRKTDARAVAGFIPDCLRMLRRLVADPATSRAQRLALIALIAYLAFPIDLVPDFIPVAGQLDDAILVAAVIAWLLRTHGAEAIRAAWPGPESSLNVILRAAGRTPP